MDRRNFIKYGLILAGIGGACGCGYFLKKSGDKLNIVNVADIDNVTSAAIKSVCKKPFEYLEIHPGGVVYPCCPSFLKEKNWGNIIESKFDDIWNGEQINKLRNKLLNNDFSMCKRDICYFAPSEEYTKDFDASKQGPKSILLCYDQECNYKCITCRDKIFTNSDEELKILDNVILPKVVPLLKDLDEIWFSGGDPLASRHSRKLIKEVCKHNKKTKLSFNTQGYFFDEKNLKELGVKKVEFLSMSVHSANRETYKKIMGLDAWDRIMKNLEFVSEWKKLGKINEVGLNFVVHSLNYKEMPAFVKIAKKFGVHASFWAYQPWPTAEMHKHYKEVAVFEPYHKDFPEFKKILHNPIFQDRSCCWLAPNLQAIADS